jgi:hypothetical protein
MIFENKIFAKQFRECGVLGMEEFEEHRLGIYGRAERETCEEEEKGRQCRGERLSKMG